MSKKIIAAALAAITLVTTVAATGGQAQAKSWGTGLGIGIAAGALVGAAAASNYGYGYYGAPAYVVEPGYGCRRVARYDAWGNYIRSVRVCDVY